MGKVFRFFHPRRTMARPPYVLVNTTSAIGSSREEMLVIMAGRARNPKHATELFTRYRTDSAIELLKLLPPRPRITFRSRLRLFLHRVFGHDRLPTHAPAHPHLPRRVFFKR